MTDSSASHQANAPQEERFTPENVFVVEVESPILPMSKPRLRWTQELHERFTHAAEELGGYFNGQVPSTPSFESDIERHERLQMNSEHIMTDSSASHQANAPPEERFSHENVLVVEVESPILPMSKPRLRWTPELHERFTRAAEELGGYFKAKPKAILQKMNVRGITTEQLKSHLQKVRNSILHTSSSAGGILSE
ncbi:hypothetical protein ACET3Z_005845 [Daucus carota]